MANITEESKDYPKDNNESKIEKLLKENNNRPPKCACHNNGRCHGC